MTDIAQRPALPPMDNQVPSVDLDGRTLHLFDDAFEALDQLEWRLGQVVFTGDHAESRAAETVAGARAAVHRMLDHLRATTAADR